MNIKNVKFALVGAFALTITSLTLLSSKAPGSDAISIANVKAMTEEVAEAPGGGAECAATTQNKCKITLPSGVILEGVGQPKATF